MAGIAKQIDAEVSKGKPDFDKIKKLWDDAIVLAHKLPEHFTGTELHVVNLLLIPWMEGFRKILESPEYDNANMVNTYYALKNVFLLDLQKVKAAAGN